MDTKKYIVKKGAESMDRAAVCALLAQAHWTQGRSKEVILRSMEHSICFGVFDQTTQTQVGFARVITDFSTAFYLCDVIIDPSVRNQGVGSLLLDTILQDPDFGHLRGVLATTYAMGFYSRHGFLIGDAHFMEKPREHY